MGVLNLAIVIPQVGFLPPVLCTFYICVCLLPPARGQSEVKRRNFHSCRCKCQLWFVAITTLFISIRFYENGLVWEQWRNEKNFFYGFIYHLRTNSWRTGLNYGPLNVGYIHTISVWLVLSYVRSFLGALLTSFFFLDKKFHEQVIVSLGSGPWDQLFGGGNSPAFAVAAVASLAAGLTAILAIPRSSAQKPRTIVWNTQLQVLSNCLCVI